MSVLSIVEWVIWGIILACGLWFAIGIRTAATQGAYSPTWPTLIISFYLVILPVTFLFLEFSKLHIVWILFIIWKISVRASFIHVPIISKLLIWPAYIYACTLIAGTGASLSSPSKQSPWAARHINDFGDATNETPHEFSNVGKTEEQCDEDAQKIGLELSNRFKKSIENISNTVPSIEDIDASKLTLELTILTYVSQRLALQAVSKTDKIKNRMREVCRAFDSYASEFIPSSSEFHDLLDQRGEQYFKILQSHTDTINHDGDWKEFFHDLGCRFDQFAHGGGGENDPLIIGDFFTSMMPLMSLASQYWNEGFTKTIEYFKTQEPL